jgi:hypothetical protein
MKLSLLIHRGHHDAAEGLLSAIPSKDEPNLSVQAVEDEEFTMPRPTRLAKVRTGAQVLKTLEDRLQKRARRTSVVGVCMSIRPQRLLIRRE